MATAIIKRNRPNDLATMDPFYPHPFRMDEKKEEKDNYLYQERSYTNFHRTLELPREIMSDNAEARLEDGILTISLPKKELPESSGVKKLEIK